MIELSKYVNILEEHKPLKSNNLLRSPQKSQELFNKIVADMADKKDSGDKKAWGQSLNKLMKYTAISVYNKNTNTDNIYKLNSFLRWTVYNSKDEMTPIFTDNVDKLVDEMLAAIKENHIPKIVHA